jgi:hypothetical protein
MHPELSQDGDKTVFLSYSGDGGTVRLLKISLQPPASGESASKLAAAAYGTALPAPTAKAPSTSNKSSAGNSAAAPAASPSTPAQETTPATMTPGKTKVASSTRKLSFWERMNLYIKRHWNALISSLSK